MPLNFFFFFFLILQWIHLHEDVFFLFRMSKLHDFVACIFFVISQNWKMITNESIESNVIDRPFINTLTTHVFDFRSRYQLPDKVLSHLFLYTYPIHSAMCNMIKTERLGSASCKYWHVWLRVLGAGQGHRQFCQFGVSLAKGKLRTCKITRWSLSLVFHSLKQHNCFPLHRLFSLGFEKSRNDVIITSKLIRFLWHFMTFWYNQSDQSSYIFTKFDQNPTHRKRDISL